MKVFVQTAGKYSATEIVGIFSSQEKLDEFVAKYNSYARYPGLNDPDVWELDGYEIEPDPDGLIWVVAIELSTNKLLDKINDMDIGLRFESNRYQFIDTYRHGEIIHNRMSKEASPWTLLSFHADREVAIKAASEMRREFLSQPLEFWESHCNRRLKNNNSSKYKPFTRMAIAGWNNIKVKN